MFVHLKFLSIYKIHWVNNCIWFNENNEYYVFKKNDKIFYLDKKNNLLLKKYWTKGQKYESR